MRQPLVCGCLRFQIRHVICPIFTAQIVRSCTKVVADIACMERFMHRRQAVGVKQAALAVCFVIGACGNTGQVFVGRTCPKILRSAGNVYLVGQVGGDQPMLVEGKGILLVGVFQKVLAKPKGKYLGDLFHRLSCILTGLIVFFSAPLIRKAGNIIRICDAFGLGVFTAIGAAKGAELGLSFIGIILSGVITAVGGGVIRDVMSGRIPVILTTDFYATASLLGAILYCILIKLCPVHFFWMFLIIMIFVTGIRLLAIHFHLRLPVSGGKTSSYLRKKIRKGFRHKRK